MAKKKKTPRKSRPVKSKKARVQKKYTKPAREQLAAAGVSREQIKTLPSSVLKDPRQVEKVIRTQELLDLGLSPSIIARADLTSKELSKKSLTDWRTRGQKLDELNRLGIDEFTAGDLRLSWPDFVKKFPGAKPPPGYKIRGTSGNKPAQEINSGIRWTGNEYLYIGAAEVQGGFHAEDLTGLSDKELAERINERIAEASTDPDGSSDLYCVFQVHQGSRSDCQTIAKFYYGRGYNITADHMKTVKERYQRLTVSNSFSQREFHEMVYTCITQMKNEDVSPFISQMRAYCNRNGFPFMKNL